MIHLTEEQNIEIASIPYLKDSPYSNLDFEKTLQYIVKRYIVPIEDYISIKESTLADCGCGYGWLAFGFLLSGGKNATLCDIDVPRLQAAEKIAEVLGIRERCYFVPGPMESLSFDENKFDIFACIETLEHVGDSNIDRCIDLITRSTKTIVLLTTPNKLFPLVIHDNKVPMSHWIPPRYRTIYTRLFGVHEQPLNEFVGPWRLRSLRKKFRPVSTTLTFSSYKKWKNSYPFYSPYNYSGRWKERPSFILKILYLSLEKLFGTKSYLFAPNLCRVWIRK